MLKILKVVVTLKILNIDFHREGEGGVSSNNLYLFKYNFQGFANKSLKCMYVWDLHI